MRIFFVPASSLFQFPVDQNHVYGKIVFQVPGKDFSREYRPVLSSRAPEIHGEMGKSPGNILFHRLIYQHFDRLEKSRHFRFVLQKMLNLSIFSCQSFEFRVFARVMDRPAVKHKASPVA